MVAPNKQESGVDLPSLYGLLTREGALTPAEALKKVRETHSGAKYGTLYSRLRYGTEVGALIALEGRRGDTRYRADPEWDPSNHGAKGGAANDKAHAHAILLDMRSGDTPAPYREIGRLLGITGQAAHAMHQRLLAGAETKGSPP